MTAFGCVCGVLGGLAMTKASSRWEYILLREDGNGVIQQSADAEGAFVDRLKASMIEVLQDLGLAGWKCAGVLPPSHIIMTRELIESEDAASKERVEAQTRAHDHTIETHELVEFEDETAVDDASKERVAARVRAHDHTIETHELIETAVDASVKKRVKAALKRAR